MRSRSQRKIKIPANDAAGNLAEKVTIRLRIIHSARIVLVLLLVLVLENRLKSRKKRENDHEDEDEDEQDSVNNR
jgi:hypothetical protein